MSGVSAETLFLCLVCGVLLGLLFAVFEFFRMLFSLGKFMTAVLDLLFCFLAAVATFLLSLAVSAGYPRFFQIACEAVGFLCVQVTLTHGVCRLLPYLKRRGSKLYEALLKRFGGRQWKKRRKKPEASPKSEKKRALFLNKSKKSEKRA